MLLKASRSDSWLWLLCVSEHQKIHPTTTRYVCVCVSLIILLAISITFTFNYCTLCIHVGRRYFIVVLYVQCTDSTYEYKIYIKKKLRDAYIFEMEEKMYIFNFNNFRNIIQGEREKERVEKRVDLFGLYAQLVLAVIVLPNAPRPFRKFRMISTYEMMLVLVCT